MEERRRDDARIAKLLRGQAELDKRLALVEQRQGDVIDDLKKVLTRMDRFGEFMSEMVGAAKASRIIQTLLAIAIALIALGNALGVHLGGSN